MSCVIAVFNDELGILASDGRASSVDAQGKIVIAAEDAYKHLQLDRTIAVATAGVGVCAVPVLRMLREVHRAFRGRSKDLLGGLQEFVKLIPKPRKGDFADAPVPLAIVFLAADPKTGKVQLTLVHGANDYQGQTFQCLPGGPPQMVILSPCDETTNFIQRRLNDVLPQIFKKRGQSLIREAKAAIWLAIADASKNDQRINAQVGFATVCRTENPDSAEVPGPTVAMDSPRSCLRIVGDSIHRILRFYVGSILTPADGDPDTVGNNDGGTGAQSGSRFYSMATAYENLETTLATDPTKAFDGVLASFALLSAQANNPVRLDIFAYPNSPFPASRLTLKIYSSHSFTAGGTSTGIIRYSKDGRATWVDVRNSTAVWDATVTPDEVDLTGTPLARIAIEAEASQVGAGTSYVTIHEAPVVVTS